MKLKKMKTLNFLLKDSELVLFVAAESGNNKVYPRLKFNLSNGTYKISTIQREDEKTSVICHHFRKIV